MAFWQQILLGGLALAALWMFYPAVRRSIKESPESTASDWAGVLLPIAAVVSFVLFLMALI